MMTEWTALVEATADRLDDDTQETITIKTGGAVLHDAATGRLRVTMPVQAASLDAAAEYALNRVRAACRTAGVRARLVEIRVLASEEYSREVEHPAPTDIVGYVEIGEILNVSRQRARELGETNPDFPAPIARLAVGPVFTRQSVEAFEARWPRKRTGRPPKIA